MQKTHMQSDDAVHPQTFIGHAYFATGTNFAEATVAYTLSLKDDAKKSERRAHTLAFRAAAFAKMGRLTQAMNDAMAAVKIECTSVTCKCMARVQRQASYLEDAVYWFRQSLEKRENSTIRAELSDTENTLRQMNMLYEKLREEESNLFSMVKWLHDHGAVFPFLALRRIPGNQTQRSVYVLADVAPLQTLLFLPEKLIISSDVVFSSDIARRIADASITLRSRHSYFASWLLQECDNPNSFWKPYLDCLPSSYTNIPIFFSNEEKKELIGSTMLQLIDARIDNLKSEYLTLRNAVEFPWSLEQFIIARLHVITRIFGYERNGEKTDGLCPLADMVNHMQRSDGLLDTRWTYDNQRGGFTITSARYLNAGDECYDSYGRKCNSRFLLNYGFTLLDNIENEACLTLALDPVDELHFQKQKILNDNGLETSKQFHVPMHFEPLSDGRFKVDSMLGLSRMIVAGPHDFQSIHLVNKMLSSIDPICISNELAALRCISIAASAALQNYPTSIEDDEYMLSTVDKNLQTNLWNCIVLRIGEKRVLQFWAGFVDKMQPLFTHLSAADLEQLLASSNPRGIFDAYIIDVVLPLLRRKQ